MASSTSTPSTDSQVVLIDRDARPTLPSPATRRLSYNATLTEALLQIKLSNNQQSVCDVIFAAERGPATVQAVCSVYEDIIARGEEAAIDAYNLNEFVKTNSLWWHLNFCPGRPEPSIEEFNKYMPRDLDSYLQRGEKASDWFKDADRKISAAWGNDWRNRVPEEIRPANGRYAKHLLDQIRKAAVHNRDMSFVVKSWIEAVSQRCDMDNRGKFSKNYGKRTTPRLTVADVKSVNDDGAMMIETHLDEARTVTGLLTVAQAEPRLLEGPGTNTGESGASTPATRKRKADTTQGMSSESEAKKVQRRMVFPKLGNSLETERVQSTLEARRVRTMRPLIAEEEPGQVEHEEQQEQQAEQDHDINDRGEEQGDDFDDRGRERMRQDENDDARHSDTGSPRPHQVPQTDPPSQTDRTPEVSVNAPPEASQTSESTGRSRASGDQPGGEAVSETENVRDAPIGTNGKEKGVTLADSNVPRGVGSSDPTASPGSKVSGRCYTATLQTLVDSCAEALAHLDGRVKDEVWCDECRPACDKLRSALEHVHTAFIGTHEFDSCIGEIGLLP